MKHLRTIREKSEVVKSLGKRKINGQEAVGFVLSRKYGEITVNTTVWAHPMTGLPILIGSPEDIPGAESMYRLSNIMFDPKLDESLFSTSIPKGYTKVDAASPLFNTGSLGQARFHVAQSLSIQNLNRLGMALAMNRAATGDKWPDSLEELVGKYRINEKHLISPHPNEQGIKIPYVYIKPSDIPSDNAALKQRMVVYEQYTQWKGRIFVLMGSGRVRPITDEKEFKKLLQEAKSRTQSD